MVLQLQVLDNTTVQTHQPLGEWIEDSGVLELTEELGISICYWNVMDSGKDCVDLLDKLLDQYGTRLNYILVQNQLRDEHFKILEQSGVKERALAFDARVMTLKRLHAPVMTKIDSNSYSFWAAKNKDTESIDALGLLERQRVKIWLNHAYKEIESLGV